MSVLPRTPAGIAPPPPPPRPAPESAGDRTLHRISQTSLPDHLRLFADAGRRARPVRRAAALSAVSGWMMLLFAAVTLASGIFSLRAGTLGLALLFTALIELRFARRLRAFEGRAATILAINQLVVGAALIVYAVTGMVGAMHGPSPYETYLSQGGQIADMVEPIAQLHSFLALVMYGLLIAGVLISQPCLAWYYLSRRRRIEAYREQTPRWVAESLEAAGV